MDTGNNGGKVLNINFVNKCRACRNVPPGSLLPPLRDTNMDGKTRVRITHGFLSRMFGTHGYTDFTETKPGYVHIYIPTLGFADIPKAFILEDDNQ